MALKPTIYKFEIHLSDLDREYYDSVKFPVAQHPSESVERMFARVLAYCLNATPNLAFTRGVSATDEPDIWCHNPASKHDIWIEIGEPSFERLKRASRLSESVRVYAINNKAEIWWRKNKQELAALSIECFHIPWSDLVSIAESLERSVSFSCTIAENTCHIALSNGEHQIAIKTLEY